MKAIKPVVIAISILLAVTCAYAQSGHADHPTNVAPYAAKVHWHSLSQGKEVAREENKPLLIDFAVPEGCPRCEFLENNVYNKDDIVGKINTDFVPVWIDLSGKLTPEEEKLGELYDYENDCLLLFLDHRGYVIHDPEGKRMCFAEEIPAKVFIEYLDYVRGMYTP